MSFRNQRLRPGVVPGETGVVFLRFSALNIGLVFIFCHSDSFLLFPNFFSLAILLWLVIEVVSRSAGKMHWGARRVTSGWSVRRDGR